MDAFDDFLKNLKNILTSVEDMCSKKLSQDEINDVVAVLSGRKDNVPDDALFYTYFLYCGRVLSLLYEARPSVFARQMEFTRISVNSENYELNSELLEKNPINVLFYMVMILVEYFSFTANSSLNETSRTKDYIECLPSIQSRISEISLIANDIFGWTGIRLSYLGFVLIADINRYKISKISDEYKRLEDSNIKKLLEDTVKAERSVKECLNNQSAFLQEISIVNDKLSEHKSQFKFVELGAAFESMRKIKGNEKNYAYVRLWLVLIALLSIPVILIFYHEIPGEVKWKDFLFYIPFVTLEILLFYIMRLFYLEVGSIKAQMLQIDMRLSLCEFIKSYIETREKNTNSADSWASFESLIFSPIQMKSENIPSVLDGANAVAEVLGKVMPKK
ncbi:hypothetical protein JOE25_000795 [Serratia sp. PL17]|uniref:hypothetical protein n=1 Tax=Serratia sp. PL17 TaxID=2806582 RepID=UPI001AE62448|nr:hypothetical protein [Serratia sp. PL17]MBP1129252.1 hypothetical protein [Serratia sp. PL17]